MITIYIICLFASIKQLRKSIKTIEKNRLLQLEHLSKLVFSILWLVPENFAMHYKLEIGSSGEKKKISERFLIIDASNNDFEYVHVC